MALSDWLCFPWPSFPCPTAHFSYVVCVRDSSMFVNAIQERFLGNTENSFENTTEFKKRKSNTRIQRTFDILFQNFRIMSSLGGIFFRAISHVSPLLWDPWIALVPLPPLTTSWFWVNLGIDQLLAALLGTSRYFWAYGRLGQKCLKQLPLLYFKSSPFAPGHIPTPPFTP